MLEEQCVVPAQRLVVDVLVQSKVGIWLNMPS